MATSIATNNQRNTLIKPEDNLQIGKPVTLSFSESVRGWTSFKSFIPQSGVSLSGEYYTFDNGTPYMHNSETVSMNTFYNVSYESNVSVVLNDLTSNVKSFKTLEYEGSQSKIEEFITEIKDGIRYNDGEYYNLTHKYGWYVDNIKTDLQEGKVPEFINKEGKWYNYIKGENSTKLPGQLNGVINKLDSREFSFQGLGYAGDVDYVGPIINKYLLIGDWIDSSTSTTEWQDMVSVLNDWNSGAVVAPWQDHIPYEDTDNSSDPFTIQGNLTLNLPQNVMQTSLKRSIYVIPKTDAAGNLEELSAHFLSVNRMHLQSTSMAPWFGVAQNYTITTAGIPSPHGNGHTEYKIVPTSDYHGLGYNYFHKLGWPIHLTTQHEDIVITEINVKEIYNDINIDTYPKSIEIELTLSEFQLDSMQDVYGNGTPASNKYIPVDVDYYPIDLPQSLVTFAVELDQIPLGGSYNSTSGQFHALGPDLSTSNDFKFTFYDSANSPVVGYDHLIQTTLPSIIANSPINNKPTIGIFPAMDPGVPINAGVFLGTSFKTNCESYADTSSDIVDAIFTEQLKATPNQLSVDQSPSGPSYVTNGYNWSCNDSTQPIGVTYPPNQSSGLDLLRELSVSVCSGGANASQSTDILNNTVRTIPFILPPFDVVVDMGKIYHDLTNTPFANVYGCTDPLALNFNALATIDDGSCIYPSWDCDGQGNCSDPGNGTGAYSTLAACQAACVVPIPGCTLPSAVNYDSTATVDDGSCYWNWCTDPAADNYEEICNNVTTLAQVQLYGGSGSLVSLNTCCNYSTPPCVNPTFDFVGTLPSGVVEIIDSTNSGIGIDVNMSNANYEQISWWSSPWFATGQQTTPYNWYEITAWWGQLVGNNTIQNSGGTLIPQTFDKWYDTAWYYSWGNTVPSFPNWQGFTSDLNGMMSWYDKSEDSVFFWSGNSIMWQLETNGGIGDFDPGTSLGIANNLTGAQAKTAGIATKINLGSDWTNYINTYTIEIDIDLTQGYPQQVANGTSSGVPVVFMLGNWHPSYCSLPYGPEQEITEDAFNAPSSGTVHQGANYGVPSLVNALEVVSNNDLVIAAQSQSVYTLSFTSNIDQSWVTNTASTITGLVADALIMLQILHDDHTNGEIYINDIRVTCQGGSSPTPSPRSGGSRRITQRL